LVADWVRTHLVPRLSAKEQERVRAADRMLLTALDRAFDDTQFEPHLRHVFEGPRGERIALPANPISLLDQWLSSHRTVRGLAVAGECLRHIGIRRDQELLDRYPIEGDPAAVERVKAGVRFSVCRRTLE
jgi:hypothetical protein